MSSVPSAKIHTIHPCGRPFPASHSAHSVGHSRSSVPIGLSSRIRRSYSVNRLARAAKLMGRALYPAVSGPEKIAGAAQQEILARDLEAVGILEDHAQTLARGLAERILIEQDAHRLRRP